MVISRYRKSIYPLTAILKASYHVIDRCYIHLDETEDEYLVQLTSKGSTPEKEMQNALDNELLAQIVRYRIYEQTHEIRNLLVARAMASTIINDEVPVIEDAVPDDNLQNILKDWFENEDHQAVQSEHLS